VIRLYGRSKELIIGSIYC